MLTNSNVYDFSFEFVFDRSGKEVFGHLSHDVKADVVSCSYILATGISQPDHQLSFRLSWFLVVF